jgi:sensor histidine kinase YesM
MDIKYWLRILAVNVTAAVAIIGISGGFTPGVTWRTLGRAFGICLVYSNCIGTLLAIGVPRIAVRCPDNRPVTSWGLVLVTLIVGSTIGTFVATGVLSVFGVVEARLFWKWFNGALTTSIFISLIIGIGVTAYESLRGRLSEATLALRTKERDEADARRLAAEAQLTALENRVQPHFLFNTLNSIAALTHEDPARAERMTTQLASLLRSSLDSQNVPLVPLGDELQTVRNYLEIERVRFGERLRYTIDADDALKDARVPRLAIQTLVENSVKYAISPRREGGSIAVHAAAANGHLRVDVTDDGPGFDASALPEGHGLALLRARLDMLFPRQASLAIDGSPGATSVRIELPS